MPKKIFFLTGSCDRDIWMWKIYKEMTNYENIDPYFIATREKNIDFLISKGIKKEHIIFFLPPEKTPELNLEYLEECEKRYKFNIWDAWYVTAVRKKKRTKTENKEVLGYFQHFFRKIESAIKEIKPDYYVCYGPAGYHTIILHEVLRQNNVQMVELVASMIPNRFTFSEDLSNTWPSLIKTYELVRKKGLSKKNKEKAEQFINGFRKEPEKPDCAKTFKEPINNKIKRLFSYSFQLLKYRKLPPDLRFIFWPVIQKIYDHLGIFEKPVLSEKYVFFPLHFQPEATTLIYGKWYVDQATLIENLSKSIPITHMLYVKEHPFGYGNRNLSFYKRIKRLPNVRLLSPHENNFKLIKNCSLLATISGTAGWEALLFQLPPITFGNVFYNIYEETKKVEKIEELPEIIRNRIDKRINYDKLVEFVAAMFLCSYEGLARLPSDCNDRSLEKNNIKLLVNGILNYMQKQKK